jgi:drug/metabolite transporter (DMT)-like permease
VKSTFAPRDAALLFLLALLWGHSFLFIKMAVNAVPPTWIVITRMLVGSALLLALMALRREPIPRDAAILKSLAIIGFCGSAAPWASQAWAQHFLDSGLVAVLNACTPLVTLVLAVLTGQEKLERNRIIGIGIAILGTLVVVGGEIGAGRSALALGASILASVGYAYAAVATRAQLSGRVSSLSAASGQLLLGALALLPIAWLSSGPPPTTLAWPVIFALAGLGVLGTGFAFLIYFTLIARVGATNTAMVTYLVPVVAVSAGAFYRGERFGPNVFVGAVLLMSGVWMAQRTGRAVVPLRSGG